MTFDPKSFTAAKRLVFEHLLTAGAWREGQHAVIGFLPPRLGVWGITFGGGGDVRNTWNQTTPSELRLDADIEGQYARQEEADEAGMRILSKLAIWHVGHVQVFRMRAGGQLDVGLAPKKIANEGVRDVDDKVQPVMVWVMRIGCELVFNTDGETIPPS